MAMIAKLKKSGKIKKNTRVNVQDSHLQDQSSVIEANKVTSDVFEQGIPPARIETQRKVGKKTWKPASLLHFNNMDPEFNYHFFDSNDIDGQRIRLKEEEGWEVVRNPELSPTSTTMNLGTKIDSAYRVGALILMRMPKDTSALRKEYIQDKIDRKSSTKNMMSEIKGRLNRAYGEITRTNEI